VRGKCKELDVGAVAGHFAPSKPYFREDPARVAVQSMEGEDAYWLRVFIDGRMYAQVQVDRVALFEFARGLAKAARFTHLPRALAARRSAEREARA